MQTLLIVDVSIFTYMIVYVQIGSHVGTDQFLTCLLVVANLFSLPESDACDPGLDREELMVVAQTRRQVALLLNRYLRVKYGPKKASSKTHHHFYLMGMLKKVGKIYMQKKLQLVQANRISDIQVESQGIVSQASQPAGTSCQ